MLKAKFFGIPQINFGTEPGSVTLTGRIQALFTYLAVTRQPQDRNKLADLLWDHQTDQEAKRNLRYVLRDLRKVIGDYLIVEGQTVAFNVDLPHWFDITSFMTYLAPNMQSAASHTELGILQELLNLYSGDFLAGFSIQEASNFERWMLAQRRHFHDAMVYGLQLATEEHLNMGDYEAGLALNQYLLTLEPWREEAHRQRMIFLAASGQRTAALMQYELCCQVLEEELDAPPMNETTSLYSQIKSGLWFVEQKTVESFNSRRVAVRAYPQASSNGNATPFKQSAVIKAAVPTHQVDLGAMPTVPRLIGRREELCTLQRWLDGNACRLAAIVGLAGQGKSALAAQFVQEQIGEVEYTPAERITAQHESERGDSRGQFDSRQVKDWPFPAPKPQTDAIQPKGQVTQIIWRSLTQRVSCVALLQDLIQRLTNRPPSEIPTNFDQLSTMLFAELQQNRCLIVLDGIEAILADSTPEEQAEAESYEQLFRLFVERQHGSFLLLTSRLRPTILPRGQQQTQSVQYLEYLELEGLCHEESEELLEAHGLDTNSDHYRQLHDWYAGNPQMLSQATDLIYEIFDGNIDAFLQEDLHFLGNIGVALVRQITHLPPLQKQILHLLAAAEKPLTRQTLWLQLPLNPPKEAYYAALRALQRAYLIQQTNGQFTTTTLPTILLKGNYSALTPLTPSPTSGRGRE